MNGRPGHVPAAEPHDTVRAADALVTALRREERLIRDLIGVVQQQRHAVAHNDLDALMDANAGAHRVLGTLAEARRLRGALNERFGESGDLRLATVREWFGGVAPAALEAALEEVTAAATTLEVEVDINRRVLRGVMAATDRELRALLGVSDDPPAGYGGNAAPPAGARLMDVRA